MADNRLISTRPRPPRHPAPRVSLRAKSLPIPPDDQADATVVEGPRAVPAPPRSEKPLPEAPPRRAPERSRAEKVLPLVLLFGFGLNIGALLLEGDDLTHLDLVFAGVILLSGLALLSLTEIYRRTDRSSR
ncbi:MAG TPA: hypothetical protein VE685_07335, partial [Thermoanaerobaculia bacterium]|nr:hypothetical protein [Thermoanaerobaculia bacterium]